MRLKPNPNLTLKFIKVDNGISSYVQSVIDMIRVWPCLRLAPTAGVSPPLGKRKHSWHRLQRYNSLSKFDECIDEQNVQKLDGMDIQQFEKTFGYTWLTHLKLLEEDSAFRQQILEMKFYRRLQRRSHIMPNPEKPLKRVKPLEFGEVSDSSSDILEELEWISDQNDVAEDQTIKSTKDGVKVFLSGQEFNISPLWISVLVDENTMVAKLFESIVPIEERLLEKLETPISPFYETEGLAFNTMAEYTSGPWRNFFVGLVGEVSAEEDGNLWPNQVLHKDRSLYNVRNASDLAKFLADPNKEDIESHLGNLERVAVERNYKKGWCWHMLKTRWGQKTLENFGMTINSI